MFACVHLASFSLNDRVESRLLGVYATHDDVMVKINSVRDNMMADMMDDEEFDPEDYNLIRTSIKRMFDDYHNHVFAVYEIKEDGNAVIKEAYTVLM